jgi:hypothetical protein
MLDDESLKALYCIRKGKKFSLLFGFRSNWLHPPPPSPFRPHIIETELSLSSLCAADRDFDSISQQRNVDEAYSPTLSNSLIIIPRSEAQVAT